MPRRGKIAKRDVLEDPIYNSKLVTRLINNVMVDGKKGVAQKIVYGAFDIVAEKTGKDALEMFQEAMDNVMPVLEVKARRMGGATYQVPMEVRPERRQTLGLRIGELCGLKWEDVDFKHKTLYIRRTVQRISSADGIRKTKVVISAPKSATSFREIAIPDMLMKYFEMFRDNANHFILSGTNKPIEPRTMQYRYKKILRSAEVDNHNYHKLRHTFATNSAEKGFNVKALSAVLGHSSVTLTLNRYIHPDHTYERRLMNMCMQL